MIRFLISLACIIALPACSNTEKNRAALAAVRDFRCAEAAQVTFAGWGASGISKACLTKNGVRNGDYLTAENGVLFLKGSYSEGIKNGKWEWFDEKGNVTRNEVYVEGKQQQ